MLQEIRELPRKIRAQYGVTAENVERLIQDLAKYAQPVEEIPAVYAHPIDADDSHYVNLAITTQSTLIISRDRHLLNLTDGSRQESKDFKARFPNLTIITPDALTQQLRHEST